MFSNGNFDAPMLIDDTNPPGMATITRLKSEIRYSVSEVPHGAMIRIKTSTSETTDAACISGFSNRGPQHRGCSDNWGLTVGCREPTKLLRPSTFISSRQHIE